MITSNLVDAGVRVKTITQHDPSSAFFKLCFRLWKWSKSHATHIVFATITAVTVACAPGTSFFRILFYTTALHLDLTPKYIEKTVESKTGNKQCLPRSLISTFNALRHHRRS
ncbi:hypothetical protein PoB_004588400 [Plakobranchus ocellatus]|uniref:Odorant receptor n=1 Tax=Plakobranchus ocellatus TaxID=259542 RepID=A0AAV4BM37_9GAST|nr:hypothetical protein PoB_004588400 [Plakobranchus ocellatus]